MTENQIHRSIDRPRLAGEESISSQQWKNGEYNGY